MFNLNKSENKQGNTERTQTAPSEPKTNSYKTTNNTTTSKPMNVNNIIGEGTEFEGTLKSKGNIRIDGKFVGTINSEGTLCVSNSGAIEGDVFCKDAEFDGEVSGNIKARGKVVVKPKAHIKGDVRYYDLQVDPGAHMACTISRLNPENEGKDTQPFSSTKPEVKAKSEASISRNIDLNKGDRKKNSLPLEKEFESKKNGVG